MRSAFLLLSLLALPAAGLDPYLVKDSNQAREPGSSYPAGFAAFGDAAFFRALEPETGSEPWRSDGTPEGTWRLADVFSGDRSSNPVPYAVGGSLLFFTAEEDPLGSHGLWVTDGTPAGTVRLTDGSLGQAALWVPGQRVLYFTASDGVHGYELWRTDGMPAGTYQVADLLPGPRDPLPVELTLFQGRIWFSATGRQGGALWRTDGTPGGTVLVKNFDETSLVNYGPTHLHVVGNRLVFVAPGQNGASDLWASDGTSRGTVLLTRMARGEGDPRFQDFQATGSRLWFVVDDGRKGQELWVTDGTPQGTRALTSFPRKQAFVGDFYLPLPPTLTGGRLVFAANDGPHGAELWVTDGTVQGTRLVRDVCPGACSGAITTWRTHRGLLYWMGTNGVRGWELWVTDGTAAGTRLVRDICRGSCNGTPHDPFFLADRVLFTASDGSHGREVWSTDGTAAGTIRVSDFVPAVAWHNPFQGTVAGGELLFAADDGVHGTELWKSDGTPAGTSLVRDINDFELVGSHPEMLGSLGDTP